MKAVLCVILALFVFTALPAQETSFSLEWETSSLVSFYSQDGLAGLTGDTPSGETQLTLVWMEKVKNQPDTGWLVGFSGEADTKGALTLVEDAKGEFKILRVWEAGKKLGDWVFEAGLTGELRNRTSQGLAGGLSLEFLKYHRGDTWEISWKPSFEALFRPGGSPFWRAGMGGETSLDLGPANLNGEFSVRVDTRTDPRLRVDAVSDLRFSFRPFRLKLEPFRGEYSIYFPGWSTALASGQKVSYGSGLALRFSADPAELELTGGKIWWSLNKASLNAPRDLPWNGGLSLKIKF